MEAGITKNRIIAELTRSPHGDLKSYLPIGAVASKEEPEFLAHLIAWNFEKGQIRDSKVALPVISLTASIDPELAENAFAHIASLDPRNLVRAVRFAKEVKTPGHGKRLLRVVEQYLRARENTPKWFNGAVMQHRKSMKELYALCHIKPNEYADSVLFKGKKVGVFKDIALLKNMDPGEAAGTILNRKIPFLTAVGALGEKASDPRVALALIESMSPAELLNNTAALEKIGIKTMPALRAAYEAGLAKAADSKGVASLKATKAVAAVQDEGLKQKLQAAQEKQLKKIAIEGDWLVIADKSGSMQHAIEASRHIAATLAKLVAGEVYLVFVDNAVRHLRATGKTYDQLLAETRMVQAGGGTWLGGGVMYALDRGINVDGIAVVTDGGENAVPLFCQAYAMLAKKLDKQVPVYTYLLSGSSDDTMTPNMRNSGFDVQMFDLRGGNVDYYALPNLVQTMRTNRFSLIDEIMEYPLKKLNDVFKEAA